MSARLMWCCFKEQLKPEKKATEVFPICIEHEIERLSQVALTLAIIF